MKKEYRLQALCNHLTVSIDDIISHSYDEEYFYVLGKEYRVLSDEEADTAWEYYLNELASRNAELLSDFDQETWKDEQKEQSSRASALAKYGGTGHVAYVAGYGNVYIYREA